MIIKKYIELTKMRITIASTLTAAVGYTLARGKIDIDIFPILIGGFLLAAGSAALNQVQEAEIDAKVDRTKNRPIPSGQITKKKALLFSVIMLTIGLVVIFISYGIIVALVAFSAVILYNGVYTPLKKISPYAAIPGAFIGSVPPLVGWLAAGGLLIDPRIYYLCFFYFIWQIPHFWLLLLFFSEQYKNNNLPSLFDHFSEKHINKLTFSGILATSITGILLPTFLIMRPQLLSSIITILGVIVLLRSFSLLKRKSNDVKHVNYRIRFIDINIYALTITILIIATSIL